MNKQIKNQIEALRMADADLQQESVPRTTTGSNNSSNNNNDNNSNSNAYVNQEQHVVAAAAKRAFRFIPLKMGGGGGRTHKPSKESRELIKKEVSLEDLTIMTESFYEKAFADQTLDQFLRSHSDPHGVRFAKWIHQKLSGSNVWDQDRQSRDLKPVQVARGGKVVVHDRSSAHVAAWNCPKRPSEEVGKNFQLDECRVWMRLHFWALRESGLLETSPSFADYYVRFIGHFVRVYESKAPAFARDSFRWSGNPGNIQSYKDTGRFMKDVIGLTWRQAIAQIPASEANDQVWPYNQK